MYSIVLKQSSGPTLSSSLEERLGKAKSSNVASSIPECSSKLSNFAYYSHKMEENLLLQSSSFKPLKIGIIIAAQIHYTAKGLNT